MITKEVYIVTNKKQEHEVLTELQNQGLKWINGRELPTQWLPTITPVTGKAKFPYKLCAYYAGELDGELTWSSHTYIDSDEKLVFDGRVDKKLVNKKNTEHKYLVSRKIMDALNEWKGDEQLNYYPVREVELNRIPNALNNWWKDETIKDEEKNNRLIAIIRWVNGEDVFEVEKPKKWVVRSKESDDDADYWYVALFDYNKFSTTINHLQAATKFDTKEEAESWANAHQEVVEVEE